MRPSQETQEIEEDFFPWENLPSEIQGEIVNVIPNLPTLMNLRLLSKTSYAQINSLILNPKNFAAILNKLRDSKKIFLFLNFVNQLEKKQSAEKEAAEKIKPNINAETVDKPSAPPKPTIYQTLYKLFTSDDVTKVKELNYSGSEIPYQRNDQADQLYNNCIEQLRDSCLVISYASQFSQETDEKKKLAAQINLLEALKHRFRDNFSPIGDFEFHNLSGLNLSGLNSAAFEPDKGINFSVMLLSNVQLNNANLAEATFERCNLENANLSHSLISNGYFVKANLHKANLSLSQIPQGDFTDSNLNNANLTDATISNASFIKSILIKTNFTKAKAKSARFYDSNLQWAEFEEADLEGSKFESCDLSLTNFSKATANTTNFNGSKLVSSDFKGAKVQEASFKNANLTSANFDGADLSGADLSGAIIKGILLENVKNLRGVKFFSTIDLNQSITQEIKKSLDFLNTQLVDNPYISILREAIAHDLIKNINDLIDDKRLTVSEGKDFLNEIMLEHPIFQHREHKELRGEFNKLVSSATTKLFGKPKTALLTLSSSQQQLAKAISELKSKEKSHRPS